MRYKISENPNILGKFDTGDTVTITLYDLSDESSETLDSNSCNELGSTGVFYWSTSNITTTPTTLKEYCWVMTNGTTSQYGKIVLGGFTDDITDIKKCETNRWKIENNQLKIYDDDKSTVILTFDLKDANGNPTESNPYERTPL